MAGRVRAGRARRSRSIYYFAPDAEQDWIWITPGSVLATAPVAAHFARLQVLRHELRRLQRDLRRHRRRHRADAVVLRVGLAVLVGAELNAEIEHASPYGKDPGEKVPGEKKKIGALAERAWREAQGRRHAQAGDCARELRRRRRPAAGRRRPPRRTALQRLGADRRRARRNGAARLSEAPRRASARVQALAGRVIRTGVSAIAHVPTEPAAATSLLRACRSIYGRPRPLK